MKPRFALILWASYILTMAASIGHLAWTFGTLEPAGAEWAGWLPALAVDAGLGALAYAIQQRKRAGRRAWSLWGGIAVFTAVSGYANYKHAAAGGAAWWDALVLSAILPMLVVYLGEIISSDDAAAADAAMRAQRRAEQAQIRADAERERTQAAQMPEPAPQAAAQAAHDAAQAVALCEHCEREFATPNALSAHMRFCAARKVALSAAPANGVAH